MGLFTAVGIVGYVVEILLRPVTTVRTMGVRRINMGCN